MGVTVQRLRRWVVGGACLLVALVVGFVLYGRSRFRHIEKDLPARLGANIQQTATGWSYSQSSQGHTLFTVKASRESQLTSGHVLLHDVDIILYGPPGSGRQDHIWGSDFDYDENHGIAVSKGDVNIDLSAVHQPSAAANAGQTSGIRVRTSGLTFQQKTGGVSAAAGGGIRGRGELQLQKRRAGAEQRGEDHDGQQRPQRGGECGACDDAAEFDAGLSAERDAAV
jgi:lipopolysaccharide export system protein LptA